MAPLDTKNENTLLESSSSISITRHESPLSKPEEIGLRSNKTSNERKIGHGVTDSSFVELVDGMRAVFKVEGFENERAAYLVDLFLGFDLVPPTVIRMIGGKEGSAQKFIPDAKAGVEIREEELLKYQNQLLRMWLFDLMIANKDRHLGNFLIKNDKVYAIDHGMSMGFKSVDSEHEVGTFGKQIDMRGAYRNDPFGPTFFGQKFAREDIEKLKFFLLKPAEQETLRILLSELIGETKATQTLKRIKLLAEMVIQDGAIYQSHSNFGEAEEIIPIQQ